MNHEEHDELWDLLGKAKQPKASPFFARNVLREIRQMETNRTEGTWAWIKRFWPVPLTACAAMLIVGVNLLQAPPTAIHEEQQLASLAESVSESPDYQVIAHLDELLDAEQNSVWLDSKVY